MLTVTILIQEGEVKSNFCSAGRSTKVMTHHLVLGQLGGVGVWPAEPGSLHPKEGKQQNWAVTHKTQTRLCQSQNESSQSLVSAAPTAEQRLCIPSSAGGNVLQLFLRKAVQSTQAQTLSNAGGGHMQHGWRKLNRLHQNQRDSGSPSHWLSVALNMMGPSTNLWIPACHVTLLSDSCQ